MIPISPELADQLNLLNPQQLAFLAGYAWAKSMGADAAAVSFQSQVSAAQPAPARRVRILSASQTGNARKVAEQYLPTVPGVAHFADEDIRLGGAGITVVDLE